jgi:hypothetical protein
MFPTAIIYVYITQEHLIMLAGIKNFSMHFITEYPSLIPDFKNHNSEYITIFTQINICIVYIHSAEAVA